MSMNTANTFQCQPWCVSVRVPTHFGATHRALYRATHYVGQRRSCNLGSYALDTCVKCKKKDEPAELSEVTVEFPPYHIYMDSTAGQLEPASGARASIPEQDYWPEGTAYRVRAARAPEPTGESKGSPSYGKNPGSRRKNYKTSAVSQGSSEVTESSSEMLNMETSDDTEDSTDISSDFVVYQTEPEEEETGYEMDKKLGRPHPFIDPKVRKPIEQPLSSEDLWWNWRRAENPKSSRWQRRRPDVETVGS